MGFSPATMGIMALGSQVAGGISSASGAYYSAKAQKTALQTQARLAEVNSRIAELSAQSALEQGKQQVASLTLKAGQLKGKQKAALAANGVDINVGNAAEIRASTNLLKDIDASTLKMNALRNAFGYRMQGVNAQSQGGFAQASAAGISPAQAGFSSLLGGATQVASSWYNMNQSGMFNTDQRYASIDALAADKGWW